MTVLKNSPSMSVPVRTSFAERGARTGRTVVFALRRVAVILAYVVVALLAWQALVVVFAIDPIVLPGPAAVLTALWSQVQAPVIWAATWVTFQEAMLGFAVGATAGILLAIMLAESDLLYRLLNPYIVAFQAVPKVALVPLFMIWFGFGIWSKVVLIAVFVFFPVMVNMYSGLRSTTDEEEELMRVSHATRWQRLRHLRLYKSLPFLFAAFEASFVLCLTGAVFAELLGSGTSVGLGTMLQMYTSRLDVAGLFGIITLLSLFGVLLDALVKIAARYFLRWDRPARS
ncbi:NitT/TauT family transport system permease protein [Glaciihabitans tibetensis]|uniref:NitT/TauT family transport system permease protein n=1 Tax=Glaciihabitans tibetensis TaxID=1266600 RepID=A0A2T0VDW5_9MICO|nr:ABC transporter permease [Glaciihabitans tibetensis]PRY68351.1 NitT/TauT family transport system permease protein [Glaciihabitans tibetensis]